MHTTYRRRRSKSGPFKRWLRQFRPTDKKSFFVTLMCTGACLFIVTTIWILPETKAHQQVMTENGVKLDPVLGNKAQAKGLFAKIFGRQPTEEEKAPLRPYFKK